MTEDASTNYNRLMAAVGGALHGWSLVESALGIMFHNASDIPNPYKSGAIFDAVVSFEARIAVLDAAIALDGTLTPDEKDLWAALSSRLRKFYRKRHEIAHFGLASEDDMIKGERIAPFFSWNKASQQTGKYLTRQQIHERGGKFSECSESVTWFVNLLQRRKFAPERRPPLIAEPPLILRIRESIALKKQEQTQPSPPSGE